MVEGKVQCLEKPADVQCQCLEREEKACVNSWGLI